jgi:hypothetical protein
MLKPQLTHEYLKQLTISNIGMGKLYRVRKKINSEKGNHVENIVSQRWFLIELDVFGNRTD